MAKTYSAGVKEYRETYWMPEYTPKDTDILACFKITPQDGVPREEVAAAVAVVQDPLNLIELGVNGLGAEAGERAAYGFIHQLPKLKIRGPLCKS